MPEPIDDFLDRDFVCLPDEALRASLRQRTTGVLRGRRRLKRGAMGVALLLPLAVGLGWFLLTHTREETTPAGPIAPTGIAERKKPIEQPAPAPPERPEAPGLTPMEENLSLAQRYEVKARIDAAKQAVYLLQAGNSYYEEVDCESALRCYVQYLNVAGPEALAITATDTSLLMALKNARRKENVNAQ
jgi:hypothetical protein